MLHCIMLSGTWHYSQGYPVQGQEWKLMILVCLFQLRIIYDSVNSMNASEGILYS